jgi:phage terminase Nu1 subunit (DNA packaging protein)
VIVDGIKLAEFFGVSDRWIREWAEECGMPKVERGKYDLVECAKWRIKKLEEELDVAKNSGDADHLALKKQGQRLTNMEREFKFKKLIGELVESEAVRLAWTNETKNFRKALKALINKLVYALEEVTDKSKRQEIITREVNDCATTLGELRIENDEDNDELMKQIEEIDK